MPTKRPRQEPFTEEAVYFSAELEQIVNGERDSEFIIDEHGSGCPLPSIIKIVSDNCSRIRTFNLMMFSHWDPTAL